MFHQDAQIYLNLLDFYFRNEERIKEISDRLDPDNPAEVFIKRMKNHATTKSFKYLANTSIVKVTLVKLMREEDKRNADKQAQSSENR